MTERSLGSNFTWFVAKVVNTGSGKEGDKDPTQSGRVQIRIYGRHDDTKNIPDKNLPWAGVLLPVGSGAGVNGKGSSPVGFVKDTTVVGFYADSDKTMPIIFGILPKAGKDGGNDGETVTGEENSVPKGARTKDTGGGDKNDVSGKRMTEETGKDGQFHNDKKTVGNIKFDGKGVLDAIQAADPSNISGAIPGALAGMKSISNTLSVSGSLLSNFQKIISGKFALGDLLKLTAQVATVAAVVKAVTASPPKQTFKYNAGDFAVDVVIDGDKITAQYEKIVVNVSNSFDKNGYLTSSSASLTNNGVVVIANKPFAEVEAIAKNISLAAVKIVQSAKAASGSAAASRSAFNGGNPMQNILTAVGGLPGLIMLANKAAGIIGPLTGSFGPAVAIGNMLRSTTQTMFQGLQPAPFRLAIPPQLAAIGVIGNIAGIQSLNIPGVAGIVGGITQAVPGLGGATAAIGQISSLLNSSIQLPLVGVGALGAISRINPGIGINVNSGLGQAIGAVATIAAVTAKTPSATQLAIRNYAYNSATFGINNLQNSSIVLPAIPVYTNRAVQRTISGNPGVNIQLAGTIIRQIGR